MNECIPVQRHGPLKPYWCEELQELKKASIDAYNLWMLCDRPRDGIVNRMRIESKYKYKHALRAAGRKDNLDFNDKLSELYLAKHMDDFWIQWNRKFSKRTKSVNINGYYHNEDIAMFSVIRSSQLSLIHIQILTQLVGCLNKVGDKILCDSSTQNINLFDVVDVENALASLKLGKAAGYDGLTTESLHYCHPAIFIHLKLLFNMMSVHGYVPDDLSWCCCPSCKRSVCRLVLD